MFFFVCLFFLTFINAQRFPLAPHSRGLRRPCGMIRNKFASLHKASALLAVLSLRLTFRVLHKNKYTQYMKELRYWSLTTGTYILSKPTLGVNTEHSHFLSITEHVSIHRKINKTNYVYFLFSNNRKNN